MVRSQERKASWSRATSRYEPRGRGDRRGQVSASARPPRLTTGTQGTPEAPPGPDRGKDTRAPRQSCWMSGQFSLPAPESSRWVLEHAGPRDEILNASYRPKRALRLQAMYTDLFRLGDHPLLSKLRRFGRNCLQTDRAHSRHCCESAAALLLPFGLVEIRDALFSYDMAHVISIDHDGRDWHPCLLANLHRVESFNERRNAAFLKGLHGLNHELPAANDWRVLCHQIKPGVTIVPPAMRVVSHVRCATEPCQAPRRHRRRVRVGIHLQRRADKSIDCILPGKLTQNPVRTEAAISAGKKDIRTCRDILIHSNFAAETVNAFDPTALDRGDHCGVWVERPVFADLSVQAE